MADFLALSPCFISLASSPLPPPFAISPQGSRPSATPSLAPGRKSRVSRSSSSSSSNIYPVVFSLLRHPLALLAALHARQQDALQERAPGRAPAADRRCVARRASEDAGDATCGCCAALPPLTPPPAAAAAPPHSLPDRGCGQRHLHSERQPPSGRHFWCGKGPCSCALCLAFNARRRRQRVPTVRPAASRPLPALNRLVPAAGLGPCKRCASDNSRCEKCWEFYGLNQRGECVGERTGGLGERGESNTRTAGGMCADTAALRLF